MSDLWPTKLLRELPYPRPTTGWLADPQNAPAWMDDVHLAHFSPLQVSGCVLWLDPREDDGITLANASIANGSDLNTPGWTHTNVTPVLNQDGFGGTRFTVSTASAPAVFQIVSSCAVNTTACPPITITFRFKAGTVAFLLVETRATNALNRTWINTATGAVGTNGANHSCVVGAADAAGYRTVTVVVTANGGTPIVNLLLVTADNVTTSASVGQTIWLKDATVDQPRVRSLTNLATGVAASFDQATVNNQPGYEATGIGGRAAVRSYGQTQFLLSAEAAVAGMFSGTDKAWTLTWVAQQKVTTGTQGLWAARQNASSTPLVQFSTSSSLYSLDKRDDASTLVTRSAAGINTVAHVFEIEHTGQVTTIYRDGVQIHTGAQDVGATTLDRMVIHGLTAAGGNSPDASSGAWVGHSRVLTTAERSWIRRGLAVGGSAPYGIAVAA